MLKVYLSDLLAVVESVKRLEFLPHGGNNEVWRSSLQNMTPDNLYELSRAVDNLRRSASVFSATEVTVEGK